MSAEPFALGVVVIAPERAMLLYDPPRQIELAAHGAHRQESRALRREGVDLRFNVLPATSALAPLTKFAGGGEGAHCLRWYTQPLSFLLIASLDQAAVY